MGDASTAALMAAAKSSAPLRAERSASGVNSLPIPCPSSTLWIVTLGPKPTLAATVALDESPGASSLPKVGGVHEWVPRKDGAPDLLVKQTISALTDSGEAAETKRTVTYRHDPQSRRWLEQKARR